MLEEGPHTHLAKQVITRDLMVDLQPMDQDMTLDLTRVWLKETDTLAKVLKTFSNSGKTRILVACTDKNTPCGWIYHVDALANFNKALLEQSREEHS